MTTDDPCDELPDMHRQWLHGRVMLDRETSPTIRRSIKTAMNTHYGRLGNSYMPRAYALATGLLNDPHDSWDQHTFTRSIYSPPLTTCPRCYRVIVKGQPCYGCEAPSTRYPEAEQRCSCGSTVYFSEGERSARCFIEDCGALVHR